MTEGIYVMPSHQVFTWTLEGSSEQARRLQHRGSVHCPVSDLHRRTEQALSVILPGCRP